MLDTATEATNKSPSGAKILVVDDEETVLNWVGRTLEREGYDVITASSPSRALELIENFGDKIRLGLFDLVMPGMNGRELATTLKRKQSPMKVLFMSGYARGILSETYIIDPSVSFLPKPFKKPELLSAVRDRLKS